jgi:hypothetical protein
MNTKTACQTSLLSHHKSPVNIESKEVAYNFIAISIGRLLREKARQKGKRRIN